MREIKFRFWYEGGLNGRKMVFWSAQNPQVTLESYLSGGKDIMQFTGLKDKNGKEIYEGDIVRGWLPDSERDVDFESMVIKYEGDSFALFRTAFPKPENEGRYFGGLEECTSNKSIEIIGNIYENSELLK